MDPMGWSTQPAMLNIAVCETVSGTKARACIYVYLATRLCLNTNTTIQLTPINYVTIEASLITQQDGLGSGAGR